MNKTAKEEANFIFIAVPGLYSFQAGILAGIFKYAQKHANWKFHLPPRDTSITEAMLRESGANGVITTLDGALLSTIHALDIPAINMSCLPDPGIPSVNVDEDAVGRMAAEYFISLGFRNFGYVGSREEYSSGLRKEAFEFHLNAQGFDCLVFNKWKNMPSYRFLCEDLAPWLKSLDHPTAIFTADDRVGFYVCQCCESMDLSIPKDLAILGVGDDSCLAAFAHPELSSIELPGERMGYEAATQLDQWLMGQSSPKLKETLVAPSRIVERASTSEIALADPALSKAMAYIRSHADQGISVDDLARVAHLSRRALEMRFQEHMRSTPFEQIRDAQVRHVCRLLLDTDLTMKEIVPRSAFTTVSRMAEAVRRVTDMPPGQYRERFRP